MSGSEHKRVILKKTISLIVFIVLSIWVVLYIKNHLNDFIEIRNISYQVFMLMLIVNLIGLVLRGYFTKLIIDSFSVNLRFNEWFGITVTTGLGNYLVPFGGFGSRAVYLKKIHRFPYTYFLSTLLATYIILFFCFAFTGLFSLGFLYFKNKFFNISIFLFLLIVLIACVIFTIVVSKLSRYKGGLYPKIKKVIEGWYKLLSIKFLIIKLFGILVVRIVLLAFTIYLAFLAFGHHIYLLNALLIASLTGFSIILRITPGSLGFQEGIIIFTSRLFGFSIATGILVSGLVRLSSMINLFVLGPIFSYILMTKKKDKEYEY